MIPSHFLSFVLLFNMITHNISVTHFTYVYILYTMCSAVGCEWKYGDFRACSKMCGAGEKLQYPIITQRPEHGGQPCPPNVENNVPNREECNLRPCPSKYIHVILLYMHYISDSVQNLQTTMCGTIHTE